ncbi:MAG: DUF721 domain-containing protein [Acidimicrobiales bacterium]
MPWSPLPDEGGQDRGPRPLVEALDRVLAGLGAPPADALATIVDRWAELVGPEAARALTPAVVEHGWIVAVTASPAWASQARWLEADLVRRATELFGEGVISGLRVRVEPPRG